MSATNAAVRESKGRSENANSPGLVVPSGKSTSARSRSSEKPTLNKPSCTGRSSVGSASTFLFETTLTLSQTPIETFCLSKSRIVGAAESALFSPPQGERAIVSSPEPQAPPPPPPAAGGEIQDFVDGQGESALGRRDCYARPFREYLGFSAGLDFETKIMVKENAPELLARTLPRPNGNRRSWP